MSYVPERGDLIWLLFSSHSGHEQAGRGPALVLTPSSHNMRTDLAIVCPITSRPKAYPFEVLLPGNLPISGVVLSDHAKSLDWRIREAEFICEAPPEVVADALGKLDALLFSPQ